MGIKTKSEHKYKILAEAKEQGHRVSFRVMYHAPALPSILLKEELGEKEGEYIREHRPALNIQIPKAENWRHYTINENAKTITLSEILSQAGLI